MHAERSFIHPLTKLIFTPPKKEDLPPSKTANRGVKLKKSHILLKLKGGVLFEFVDNKIAPLLFIAPPSIFCLTLL